MKQHMLMQAHRLRIKDSLVGTYATPKLDGCRCFWDGGCTRGLLKSDVPWANCARDGRFKIPPSATGLWTRYGNVIHAPSWWLNLLPNFPLDGELWAGRGQHQFTMSTVKRLIPDDRWNHIYFGVFNSPNLQEVFHDREIDLTGYTKKFSGILDWLDNRDVDVAHKIVNYTYVDTQKCLQTCVCWNKHVQYIRPEFMYTHETVSSFYAAELLRGGEGVVFTHPEQSYICERTHGQMKQKPYHTTEAKVVGYITGRKTTRGSKLLGLMGAMLCEMPDGKRFELSGFTHKERLLLDTMADIPQSMNLEVAWHWAIENPETICPEYIEALHFPRGSMITYRYRELTDAGIPKEASYKRKREIE